MTASPVAKRVTAGQKTTVEFVRFFEFYAQYSDKPDINDFAIGNPHNMPLPEYVSTLQNHAVPQNKDWFAYKMSEPKARVTVSNTLQALHDMDVSPEDITMTNGATGAINIILQTVVDAGDEVMFMLPKWFFYELFILSAGGVPVKVPVDMQSFDLDLEAIENAITEKTRILIINSPHNPTGKIYSKETLSGLADILTRHSEKNGRTIYILSDEAYNRIVFDGHKYVSPATVYPNTFISYTYGKTLLTPGQRLGYIALPPSMPQRDIIREAVFTTQIATGWSVANALLQHGIEEIEKMSIDIEHIQYKRDWMVRELTAMGYEVHSPEGTFYLFPKSPIADEWQFIKKLADNNILCLPGSAVDTPGYFRISLTANDEMIERGLPGFKQAFQ